MPISAQLVQELNKCVRGVRTLCHLFFGLKQAIQRISESVFVDPEYVLSCVTQLKIKVFPEPTAPQTNTNSGIGTSISWLFIFSSRLAVWRSISSVRQNRLSPRRLERRSPPPVEGRFCTRFCIQSMTSAGVFTSPSSTASKRSFVTSFGENASLKINDSR